MKLVQMTNAQRQEIRYDFSVIEEEVRHPWLKASQVVNRDNNRDYGWVLDESKTVLIEELE